MLRARESSWKADQDFENARLQAAKKSYEDSFESWRKVLDASKKLRDDFLTREDINDLVGRYRKVLEQLDEPFPKEFILKDMLD